MKRILSVALILFAISCSSDNSEPTPISNDPDAIKVVVDTGTTFQEMIGFGGALTWYSPLLTGSSSKNQIADLIFTDLGIDIIRFKNWYYPDNYPSVTSTSVMTDDNSKVHWDATNELYTLAKVKVPDVKILLSSWGPPANLKSNASTREGTLKRDGSNNFMYDEFAQYWEDALDHIPFTPEYLSIQNEPTFINSGWTTCKWSASETTDLPSYVTAFDRVHDKIKTRINSPILIGPESQDIPTYASFANLLKTRDYCGALAYHPYNINSSNSTNVSGLQSIAQTSIKKNMMTEFSDNLDWFNTGLFIQSSLTEANTSAYIYWKLIWAEPSSGSENAAMVSITNAGQYTVTPFYYLIKHFAKNIDAGYTRISTKTNDSNLSTSGFTSPDKSKITVIIINRASSSKQIQFDIPGKTVSSFTAVQSKESSYYKNIEITDFAKPITLQAKSITTIVIPI
jgi:glucuronoarabinoxylan endo-1,4-beta-xylanase